MVIVIRKEEVERGRRMEKGVGGRLDKNEEETSQLIIKRSIGANMPLKKCK